MPKKTVAIVGSHIRTKDFAPYQRKYIDIWVFNEAASLGWPPRVNAVFQIHKPVIWKNPANRNDPKHYEWLQKEHPYPIYMLEKYPDVPSSVAFPVKEICDKLLKEKLVRGKGNKSATVKYFTSGPAYAVALAIYQGYEAIELYGIEMETNTEYMYQRDGVFFWIGVAIGQGIRVTLHPICNLFRAPLYGYEGDAFVGMNEFVFRETEWKKRLPVAQAAIEKVNGEQEAALEKIAQGNEAEETKKAYFDSIRKQSVAYIHLGEIEGATSENARYIERAKIMEDAVGEHQFSRQEFDQVANKAAEIIAQFHQKLAHDGASASIAWKNLHELVISKAEIEAIDKQAMNYHNAHQQYLATCMLYGRSLGIKSENEYYLHRIDELVKAAGGEKSEEVMLAAKSYVSKPQEMVATVAP